MYTYRIVGIIIALAMCMPLSVSAAQFVAREEYHLPSSDAVLESLYVGSGQASIGGQVHGDLVLGAGNATITGDVLDDALIGGGQVTVLGLIGDDIRIVGGELTIGGEVGGDVVAAGGMLHVLTDSVVQGDVYVAGGNVIIDGTVEGSVFVRGGRLSVNGVVLNDIDARLNEALVISASAVVGGELRYKAPAEAFIPDGAQIDGGVFYDAPILGKKSVAGGAVAGGVIGIFAGLLFTFKLITWLGFAILVVWMWRSWGLEMIRDMRATFFKSFGQGLVVFLLMPLAIALLLISFIGTMVGVAGIALYGLMLILARVLTSLFVAGWLATVLTKNKTWRLTYGWAILGVIVVQALFFIPIVGWLVSSVVTLVALGALFRHTWEHLHK